MGERASWGGRGGAASWSCLVEYLRDAAHLAELAAGDLNAEDVLARVPFHERPLRRLALQQALIQALVGAVLGC